MSVTDGIGQTPCSFEHYLIYITFVAQVAASSKCLQTVVQQCFPCSLLSD